MPLGHTSIVVKVNGPQRNLKTAIFWKSRRRDFLTTAHREVCKAIQINGLEALHYAASIKAMDQSASETQLYEILGGDLLQFVRRVH